MVEDSEKGDRRVIIIQREEIKVIEFNDADMENISNFKQVHEIIINKQNIEIKENVWR